MSSFVNNAGTAWLLMVAANDEALRAGHSAVDTDHLLLGMLVGSGDGAAALRALGVDLDRARRVSAELAQRDVAGLGIRDEGWTSPAPDRYAAEMLPYTDRAERVMHDYKPRQGELSLLRALVEEPNGPARRLLEALGVDPAAVPTSTEQLPSTDPDWTASTELEVALPAERIWALVTDPTRLPEWDNDYGSTTIVDQHTFTAQPSLRVDNPRISRVFGLDNLEATFRVVEEIAPAVIEWQVEFSGRAGLLRRRRPDTEWQRIELHPRSASSTRLVLRMRRDRGRHAVARWAFEARLRLLAQAIAQIA